MTTTPITDAAIIAADGRWTYELKEEMQAMERELASANERIKRLEKESESRWKLAEAAVSSCAEQEERIKRLEDAGDRLLWMAPPGLKGSKATCAKEAWFKAKEAKP